MHEVAEAFGVTAGRANGHTYGLTEGGPFVAFCRPDETLASHWGSIGRAMVGVELRCSTTICHEVSQGAAGESPHRGPHMSGYWRKPRQGRGGVPESAAGCTPATWRSPTRKAS